MKACRNVYVALSTTSIDQYNGVPTANISGMYEIYLGEKNNTQSGIRCEYSSLSSAIAV